MFLILSALPAHFVVWWCPKITRWNIFYLFYLLNLHILFDIHYGNFTVMVYSWFVSACGLCLQRVGQRKSSRTVDGSGAFSSLVWQNGTDTADDTVTRLVTVTLTDISALLYDLHAASQPVIFVIWRKKKNWRTHVIYDNHNGSSSSVVILCRNLGCTRSHLCFSIGVHWINITNCHQQQLHYNQCL